MKSVNVIRDYSRLNKSFATYLGKLHFAVAQFLGNTPK